MLEGKDALLAYGKKRIFDEDKDVGSLKSIEHLMIPYQPEFLVLEDVNNANGARLLLRLKRLHLNIAALAKAHKRKTAMISGTEEFVKPTDEFLET